MLVWWLWTKVEHHIHPTHDHGFNALNVTGNQKRLLIVLKQNIVYSELIIH